MSQLTIFLVHIYLPQLHTSKCVNSMASAYFLLVALEVQEGRRCDGEGE